MQETWYVLEDGTAVHPAEVRMNDAGRLEHDRGLVAMRGPDVAATRGVDPDEQRSAPVARVSDERADPPEQARRARPYKTRGA